LLSYLPAGKGDGEFYFTPCGVGGCSKLREIEIDLTCLRVQEKESFVCGMFCAWLLFWVRKSRCEEIHVGL